MNGSGVRLSVQSRLPLVLADLSRTRSRFCEWPDVKCVIRLRVDCRVSRVWRRVAVA